VYSEGEEEEGEEEEDELLVPEPDAEELAEDRIRGSDFELIVSV